VEPFWTICVFAFVIGGAVLPAMIGFYWFVEGPKRLMAERAAQPERRLSANRPTSSATTTTK
jgi:hypothetical protein